jgi:prepilin-type N-terminal cleavage/methylation domain-containing protein
MQRGFSLVELSIVLVILGLLTGGILAGQSLIRAAELRAVTTEYQRYIAAVNSFKDKYFALPGDMKNAQSFWGVAHATPATCITTASTTTATCNGDSDGMIEYSGSAGSNELYRFWQHLANAGLIEGTYNGIAGPGGSRHSQIGINVPPSKMTNAGWSVNWTAASTGNAEWFSTTYNNMLTFGSSTATSLTYGSVLKPEEAWNIDTKLDDGKPGMGGLLALYNGGCTLAADDADLSAAYDLANSSIACRLVFRNAF